MTSVRKTAAGLVVGLVLVGSQLYAQPTTARLGAPKTTESGLTTEEIQAQARGLVGQMTNHVQVATALEAGARASKDSIKLSCVNNGLSVTKQLLNVGKDGVTTLNTAVRSGDRSGQLAQLKRIASVTAECEKASRGLAGCIAAKDVRVGFVGQTMGNTFNYVGPKVDPKPAADAKVMRVLDNPLHDCNNLGSWSCGTQTLEYVGFASPFTP